MLLPRFTYLRPETLDEARRFLDEYGPRARLVSGGTELFPKMKYRLETPDVVIGLNRVQAASPRTGEGGELILDALMKLVALGRSSEVLEKSPLLLEAANCVAAPEIRNMGTLGGNLCQDSRCLYYNQSHDFQFVEPCFKRGGDRCYFVPKGKKCLAVYMADTAPALLCLGAQLKVMGREGERDISIEELYSRDSKNPQTLGSNEILTHVIIPPQPEKRGWAYQKFTVRGGVEFAGVSVAIVIDMEDDQRTCREVRIGVGAISAAPLRAMKAESQLREREISDETIDMVANTTAEELQVVPHHGYTRGYLREILRVQTKRGLLSALERVK
jgi:4-hydroxybenzoyl-CoA reductase beta subunit